MACAKYSMLLGSDFNSSIVLEELFLSLEFAYLSTLIELSAYYDGLPHPLVLPQIQCHKDLLSTLFSFLRLVMLLLLISLF